MFGSKKKGTDSLTKPANMPGTHSLNTLVHGTVVEGAIKAENDIRVDGVIKGSLTCSAKVIIGPTGSIEGEVRCVNAVIEGSFEGTLTVAESLNVRDTAKIKGDVKTNKLIVQSGAVHHSLRQPKTKYPEVAIQTKLSFLKKRKTIQHLSHIILLIVNFNSMGYIAITIC